ncbi:hypothetical protein ACFPM0_12905 [Pseudonocardia sulfidoxydans]
MGRPASMGPVGRGPSPTKVNSRSARAMDFAASTSSTSLFPASLPRAE